MGSLLSYPLNEFFTKQKDDIVKQLIKQNKESKPHTYDLKSVEGIDQDIWKMVNSYSGEEIESFIFDAQLQFGQNQRYPIYEFKRHVEQAELLIMIKVKELTKDTENDT